MADAPALVPVDLIGLLNELSDFSLAAARCSLTCRDDMESWEDEAKEYLGRWAIRLDERLNKGNVHLLDTKYLDPDEAGNIYDHLSDIKKALEKWSTAATCAKEIIVLEVGEIAEELHEALSQFGYSLGLYRCLISGRFTDDESVLLSGYPYLAPRAPEALGSLHWERLKRERTTCKFSLIGYELWDLYGVDWTCENCGYSFTTQLDILGEPADSYDDEQHAQDNVFRICDVDTSATLENVTLGGNGAKVVPVDAQSGNGKLEPPTSEPQDAQQTNGKPSGGRPRVWGTEHLAWVEEWKQKKQAEKESKPTDEQAANAWNKAHPRSANKLTAGRIQKLRSAAKNENDPSD